jgi:Fe-S cluster assembly protein SufD
MNLLQIPGSIQMTQMAQANDRRKSPALHQPFIGPDYGSQWLADFRRAAVAHFDRIGYPSADDEQWRFINLASITQTAFQPVAEPGHIAPQDMAKYSLAGRGCHELTFIDGVFAPAQSHFLGLDGLIEFHSIKNAAGGHSERVSRYLGHELPTMSNGFAALNAAGFADGMFLYLPAGVVVDKPIHILWITSRHKRPTVVFPRLLISGCSQSRATVMQTFASLDSDHPVLTNAATEAICGRDSQLELITIEREASHAFHITNQAAHVHAGANVQTLAFNTGALLVRNNLSVHLAEPFAQATINGLVISSGNQRVDNHTLLDHARENCPSHELYKSLLAGNAAGVFRGKILVRPDAQKTDSKQTSKTMLLSDDAVMNSQPQLEIYANDVKCTHGSTTGPIDEEQLFYLRSRGVSEVQARSLLTYAFAGDVLNRVMSPVAREILSQLTADCLRQLHIDAVGS